MRLKKIEGFGEKRKHRSLRDLLSELALDLRCLWNHATDAIWRRLDFELWELTRSPWVVLQAASQEQIETVLADPAFRKQVLTLTQQHRVQQSAPAWFQQTHPSAKRRLRICGPPCGRLHRQAHRPTRRCLDPPRISKHSVAQMT